MSVCLKNPFGSSEIDAHSANITLEKDFIYLEMKSGQRVYLKRKPEVCSSARLDKSLRKIREYTGSGVS